LVYVLHRLFQHGAVCFGRNYNDRSISLLRVCDKGAGI